MTCCRNGMGRKKRADTRRKPILQLKESKKSEGSRLAGSIAGAEYSQTLNSDSGANSVKRVSTTSETAPVETVTGGGNEVVQGSEGRMDSEFASFLKEISSLGNRTSEEDPSANEDGATSSSPDQPESSQDESATQPVTQVLDSSDQLGDMSDSGLSVSTAGDGKRREEGGADQQEDMEAPVTFWQSVVDPNTNHTYYWNPTTNEVSWTLPENGVISDDAAASKPNTASESDGASSDSTYADYYAYYAQTYYGVDAKQQKEKHQQDSRQSGATQASPKGKADDVHVDTKNGGTAAKTKEPSGGKEAGEPMGEAGGPQGDGGVPPQEGSNGTVTQTTKSGHKRKVEETEEPSVSPSQPSPVAGTSASKKPRLQQQTRPAEKKTAVSPLAGGTASRAAEQALRLQVSILSDELSRKLQYLHISSEGLTDLQVLSVQLETRLADWKDGGLSSKYILGKLKQAGIDLQQYEDQAAPEGWKTVWDSGSCRYRFHNLSTGESTWNYPIHAVVSPSSAEPRSEEASSQEEEEEEEATQDHSRKQEEPVREPSIRKQENSSEEKEEEPIGPMPAPIVAPPPVTVGHTHPAPPPAGLAPPPPPQATQQNLTQAPKPPPPPSRGKEVRTTKKASKVVPPAPPERKYKGPTMEYLTSDEGAPPPRQGRTKDNQRPGTPPPVVEDRPVSAREVRQKLKRSKGPVVSYKRRAAEKEEVEEQMESEEDIEELPQPVEGMEFISEFPPREPPQRTTTAGKFAKTIPAPPTQAAPGGQRKKEVPKSPKKPPEVEKFTTRHEGPAEVKEDTGTGVSDTYGTPPSGPPVPIPALYDETIPPPKESIPATVEKAVQPPVPPPDALGREAPLSTGHLDSEGEVEAKPPAKRVKVGGVDRTETTEQVKDPHIKEGLPETIHVPPPLSDMEADGMEGRAITDGPAILEPGGVPLQQKPTGIHRVAETGEEESVSVSVVAAEKEETSLARTQVVDVPEVIEKQETTTKDLPEAGKTPGVEVPERVEEASTGGAEVEEKAPDGAGKEEEGEVLSSSPPPQVAVGKCYMDMEEEQAEARASESVQDVGKHDTSGEVPRSTRSSKRRRSRSRSRSPRSRSRSPSRSRSRDRRREHRSSGKRSSKRSSRHAYRDDYSDSDYSDDYRSRRSSRRSHRHRDDRSDYSDEDYYRHRDRSRDRDNRKSRRRDRDSEKDEESYRRRKHRSRSRSKDSKDSREKDKSRKKKKEKKEKKKKRHAKDEGGSGDEGKASSAKPPPSVLVGKVGKVSSVRPLGQKKPEADASSKEADGNQTASNLSGTPGEGLYYQQGTGQAASYYPQQLTPGASVQYPGYQYPYAQTEGDQSAQSQAWEQWGQYGGYQGQEGGEQQAQYAQYSQSVVQPTGEYPQPETEATQPTQQPKETPAQQEELPKEGGEGEGKEEIVDKTATVPDTDAEPQQLQVQEKETKPYESAVPATTEAAAAAVVAPEEEEESIMECDMEIEEESPVAVTEEEAVPVAAPASTDKTLDSTAAPVLSGDVPSEAVAADDSTKPEDVAAEVRGEPTKQDKPVEQVSEIPPSDAKEEKPVVDTDGEAPLLPTSSSQPLPSSEPLPTSTGEQKPSPTPPESKPTEPPAPPPSETTEAVPPPPPEPETTAAPEPTTPPPPGVEPHTPPPGTGQKPVKTPADSTVTRPAGSKTKSTVAEAPKTTKPALLVTTPSATASAATSTVSSTAAATASEAAVDPSAYYQYASQATSQVSPYAYASAYGQTASPQVSYDYSNYTQGGYNYAQAYQYMQQAAAAAAYAGNYSAGQYYPTSYAGYGGTYGSSPYAGYYNTAGMYGNATAYQTATGQPAPVATTAEHSADSTKKSKKSEFALAGSKEKQMKSMMEKWSSFKDTQ